jgi:ParB/RepB/Spo0J family partition protein
LEVDPRQIRPNEYNPRLYFNEEQLDFLRTSIQEVGILVPLIVYRDPKDEDAFVLMDGERRWKCALDLALPKVPINLIPPPTTLENLLRMFNIHAVREDWPLISIALALESVMKVSGEVRESRLAQLTGLSRSTVRRAKRLLSLPNEEIDLIRAEAHWDRAEQVHREDLYLEIDAAESVIRRKFPVLAEKYDRPFVIRQFALKRERQKLRSVTEFRQVSNVIAAVDKGVVEYAEAESAFDRMIRHVGVTPAQIAEEISPEAFEQRLLLRRAELLAAGLSAIPRRSRLAAPFRQALQQLRDEIDRLLG